MVNLLSSCQVTCLDYLCPRLLVAGTTNGIIILWDVEERRVIQRLVYRAYKDACLPSGLSHQDLLEFLLRFERVESRGTNSRRVSKHGHDSDYKLVHACKIVSCKKAGISREITRLV